MHVGRIDRAGFLLAAGTDMRVRFWDLDSPADSYLAVLAPHDVPGLAPAYRDRLVDGTCVTHEILQQSRTGGEGAPRAGPEPPSAAHRDCIGELALCKASQCFLVTASRDGVIKVWK